MFGWEWEDFEDLIRSYHVSIIDVGPLKVPVRSFDLRRNEKLGLRLVVRSPQDAAGGTKPPPAAIVRFNTDKVSFSSNLGLEVVAEGVDVERSNTKIHDDPALGELVQDCRVHRLMGSLYPQDRPVAFVIDWLENLDPVFLWPDNITTSSNSEHSVVLGAGADSITMRGSSGPGGSGTQGDRAVLRAACVRHTAHGVNRGYFPGDARHGSFKRPDRDDYQHPDLERVRSVMDSDATEIRSRHNSRHKAVA